MIMNKVIVIGCPGAGKSTFSRQLNEMTGIPLYYLDMMYWNSDRTTVTKELFRERLLKVLGLENWIIDGNYGSTMEMRMAECDTVIFLDFTAETCLKGVRERKGKPRPDMPWVETEDDEEFFEFIKKFEIESKPKILELFKKYHEKEIVILKSREEADRYISSLKGD